MQQLTKVKRSNLLWHGINYGLKKSYDTGSWPNLMFLSKARAYPKRSAFNFTQKYEILKKLPNIRKHASLLMHTIVITIVQRFIAQAQNILQK